MSYKLIYGIWYIELYIKNCLVETLNPLEIQILRFFFQLNLVLNSSQQFVYVVSVHIRRWLRGTYHHYLTEGISVVRLPALYYKSRSVLVQLRC